MLNTTKLENYSIIDNFFDGIIDNTPRNWYPKSVSNDFVEYDDKYELILEVPGVAKKDINIKTEKDRLNISFDKKEGYDKKAKLLSTSNRRIGKFEQTYLLPNEVDSNAATAECKNGVLKIILPKSIRALPNVINVS